MISLDQSVTAGYNDHMATETTTRNEVPTVELAQTLGRPAVHVRKANGRATVSACNGRTMGLAESWTGPATEVTCQRCRKLVTL